MTCEILHNFEICKVSSALRSCAEESWDTRYLYNVDDRLVVLQWTTANITPRHAPKKEEKKRKKKCSLLYICGQLYSFKVRDMQRA